MKATCPNGGKKKKKKRRSKKKSDCDVIRPTADTKQYVHTAQLGEKKGRSKCGEKKKVKERRKKKQNKEDKKKKKKKKEKKKAKQRFLGDLNSRSSVNCLV
jgi:hypothetical protein